MTSSTWMIDSGSFTTLTPYEQDFTNYTLLKTPVTINALGGFQLQAIARGTVVLRSNVNDCTLKLQDVLHVPMANGRIISVAQLLQQGNRAVFENDLCSIYSSGFNIIMSIPLDKKTYQFTLSTQVLQNTAPVRLGSFPATMPSYSLQELHIKCGHAHPYILKSMAKKLNWVISDPDTILDCPSCIRGKSTKVIHAKTASRSAEHFGHIVSGDLIDLHDTPSIGNYKYVSVLVDQYTYFTSVMPLKTKSAHETRDHILAFSAFIYAQTGRHIRIFRSDAGNEYRGVFTEAVRALGIHIEIGAPHEPRDNGFAERRNRTLTEMARTVLLASKLPLQFWPFAYDYACFTQNRLGRRGYDFQSPYYLVFGRIPEYNKLQPFGRVCFMQHTEQVQHKLSARSDPAIFLGYGLHSVGYKVFYRGGIRLEQSVHFPELPQSPAPAATVTPSSPITPVDPSPVVPSALHPAPSAAVLPANDSPMTPSPNVPTSSVSPPRQSSRPSIQTTITKIQARVAPRRVRRHNSENLNNQVLNIAEPKSLADIPDSEFPAEPIGFKPSLKGPLAPYWAEERDKEISNWLKLQVAEVSDLPAGQTAIPGHWIHSVKRDAQGKLVRLKARCVADGNHQTYGHNYTETYAATPAPEVARILLTVAAAKDWIVHQMDVDCAYLNATLTEPVYMKIPPGINIDHKPGQVFKLLRALYGLKQAGREWSQHLNKLLSTLGWKQSPREPCLYSRKQGEFILVYVDDLLLVSPKSEDIAKIKSEISNVLKVKDLGEIHDYLGIEIKRDISKKSFFLRQVGLIDDITHVMQPEKIRITPMSTLYDPTMKDQPLNATDHNKYRSVLGKLLYLSRITRPDISIATNLLGRTVSAPTQAHLLAMKRVAGYLLGSRELYLRLDGSGPLSLTGMSDADWAGDTSDRKSTSGYICYLGKSPITWSATKQKCVAGSTMYAEYIALSDAAKEMTYILNLASSITSIRGPGLLYCDNTAAQMIATNQSGNVTKGAKHIDIRYHLIKELINDGKIAVERIDTNANTADTFTKPLDSERFLTFREDLGLGDLFSSHELKL